MQRFKFGLVAALFLLVCLLVLAPARLVTVFIPAGQAQLQGVNGSLWHGTASRAVVSTQVGALQLGQLEWRIKPWSLLLLAPRVELRSQWGQQYLNAQLLVRGAEDIDLNAVDVRLPAELVKQVLPLELAGLVSLQASRLSVRAGCRWRRKVAWSGSRPVGEPRARFGLSATMPLSLHRAKTATLPAK
ncbi:type II secretion system protein N [Halioglobus japonicus]|uniref:type II secretion system protein N n=1 Tax=Halioglobus japonicus TaxID=930805 RepID=UPI000A011EEF|nr:type II secretion system protein N [Halioglobus japonicus]